MERADTRMNFCKRCKKAYVREVKSAYEKRKQDIFEALADRRDDLPKVKRTDTWVFIDHSKRTVSFK